MERILFERPREKLQAKGVAYLSTVELLQVIIGSGNAKASAARLAKRVAGIFESKDISLGKLLNIDGIGTARACQLIAAIELGTRLYIDAGRIGETPPQQILQAERITQLMSKYRQKVLCVYLFDGAYRELSEKVYILSSKLDTKTLARDVSTDAMLAGSRSAIMAIGHKKGASQADIAELSLIKAIREALDTLQVSLSKVYIANNTEVYEWRGA